MATAISTTSSTTLSSTSSSPSMSFSQHEYSRVVRFDNECVLIPELQRTKRPIIITKSYSLPLWKRSKSDDEFEEPTSPVLKVPFPNFKAKPTRSPSHGRDAAPLSPCLVHRSPSSSRTDVSPRHLERRPSLPNSPVSDNGSSGRPRSIQTQPLRSCCPDCVPITEESLKEGDSWVEKFTRGARRRRNSSAEEPLVPSDCGFTPVASSHQGQQDVAIISSHSKSITVDEVDKRRRSREFTPQESFSEISSPMHVPIGPLNASAIIEEDEDQLFPLPSPRRTPNGSPANSATPSPNASTQSFPFVRSESPRIPEEGILTKSLTRKGRCENGFLTPDADAGPLVAQTDDGITTAAPPIPPLSESPTPMASSSLPTPSSPSALESPLRLDSEIKLTRTRSPERSSPVKERRPSFGATVLRAGTDLLKGVSLTNAGAMSGGMSV